MAARYQKTRLLIGGALAATVVSGTAYFASRPPESFASGSASSTATATAQTPKTAGKNTTAKRSRGS